VSWAIKVPRYGDRSTPSRSGSWRTRSTALALLAGPLAEGDPAPTWPLQPSSDDERMLARLVGDGDELSYLELVRDSKQIMATSEFTRMHKLAGELLAHPPHELDGTELSDIRKVVTERKSQAFPTEITIKSHDRGEPHADVERDELGVIADSVVERDIAQLRGETEQTAVEADPRHALARREWASTRTPSKW
jgi:hypothetical protein